MGLLISVSIIGILPHLMDGLVIAVFSTTNKESCTPKSGQGVAYSIQGTARTY